MWRPKEGWENIYDPVAECGDVAPTDIFEAGADAMLKALEPLIKCYLPDELVDILYKEEKNDRTKRTRQRLRGKTLQPA